MDASDVAVIAAAIGAGLAALGTAIRFVGKRALKSYDARTEVNRQMAESLTAQEQQLAVFTEASRETNRLLLAVLGEVQKLNTKLSTAMHMQADTTPPTMPLPVESNGLAHERKPTSPRGVPTGSTPIPTIAELGARKK